jgi:hypothetical protein
VLIRNSENIVINTPLLGEEGTDEIFFANGVLCEQQGGNETLSRKEVSNPPLPPLVKGGEGGLPEVAL